MRQYINIVTENHWGQDEAAQWLEEFSKWETENLPSDLYITFEVEKRNANTIYIDNIFVPEEIRSQGWGTKIMETAIILADKYNITLSLSPVWQDDEIDPHFNLYDWYKRFDFESGGDDGMIRYPHKNISENQIVNEINIINDFDDDVNARRIENGIYSEEFNQSVRVASVGSYDINEFKDLDQTRYFFSDSWGNIVGTALIRVGSYTILNNTKDIITVNHIWLNPKVRNRGLGFGLYSYLINKGYQILSDVDQTEHAMRLWKKLARTFTVRSVRDNRMGEKISDISEFYGKNEYQRGRLARQ